MSNLTKIALASSLKQKLTQKEISSITIGEITKEAGVNRKTFYYHFDDIYSLIEWIYKNEIIDKLRLLNDSNDWKKTYLFIIDYVMKNKKFIIKTYKISQLEDYVFHQTVDIIRQSIEKSNTMGSISETEKNFMARFYSHAFVGILGDWIDSDVKGSPEDLVNSMNKIIERDMSNIKNITQKTKNV